MPRDEFDVNCELRGDSGVWPVYAPREDPPTPDEESGNQDRAEIWKQAFTVLLIVFLLFIVALAVGTK